MKIEKGLAVFIFCFFLSGCTQSAVYTQTKIESTSYSEKILEIEEPLELDLVCDYANIEVYAWDKKEIKFEMKRRVRGVEEKNKLEEKLKDFSIDIKQDESKICFTSQYKGSIKNSEDKMLDLRLYIPKKVRYIKQKVEKGYIRYLDDIRCTLGIEAKTAQIEINRVDGAFNIKLGTGNVKIGSGIIKGDSEVAIDTGNIFIRSQYQENIHCSYTTKTGNIELYLPSDLKLGIESFGTIEANDFNTTKIEKGITVKSGIGKISMRKF